jgi:hypothetical protein
MATLEPPPANTSREDIEDKCTCLTCLLAHFGPLSVLINPVYEVILLQAIMCCPCPFHVLPFHSSTWFVAQAFVSDRFSVPLVPPPTNPLPVAVVTPVIVPSPPANAMSSSGEWLVVVFSLLSNVALNELSATRARPLLVSLPSSHACTAWVTLTRMYWFLSAVVTLTFEAIAAPSGGALLASIVPSNHAPLM